MIWPYAFLVLGLFQTELGGAKFCICCALIALVWGC